AYHKATMGMVNNVFGNDDVLQSRGSFFSCSARFHTNTVIAGMYGAMVNNSIFTARQVDSIAVLSIIFILDLYITDNEVIDIFRVEGKVGRVFKGRAIYQYIFAAGNT